MNKGVFVISFVIAFGLFGFNTIDKNIIPKNEKERMYQIALDMDSLTPWLQRIYNDTTKYGLREGGKCFYMEKNENVDSSYTLFNRGIKVEIHPFASIAMKTPFMLRIIDVEQTEDAFKFKINYSWVCSPYKQETCTQVYGVFHFLKVDNKWQLASHNIYEEISYNKFDYVNRDLLMRWKKNKLNK